MRLEDPECSLLFQMAEFFVASSRKIFIYGLLS